MTYTINGRPPRVLDLFCGAGGISAGWAALGCEVLGVDLADLRDEYPKGPQHAFVQGTWQAGLTCFARWADIVHASPVCKGYANVNTRTVSVHQREIPQVREALIATGKPFVIENVDSAKWDMRDPVRVCGSSFGLRVRRHRWFEPAPGITLSGSRCDHAWQDADKVYLRRGRFSKPTRSGVMPVNGVGKQLLGVTTEEELALRREAMGIDWMSWGPLTQAVPPAFAEFIGAQVLDQIGATRSAD